MSAVEQYYSPKDLAATLRVSLSTVRRYLKTGYQTKGVDGIWPWSAPTPQCVRIPASAVNRFLQRSQPQQV